MNGAFDPCLLVDLTPQCVTTLPEADVGPYCSNLAPHVTALRTEHGRGAKTLGSRSNCFKQHPLLLQDQTYF